MATARLDIRLDEEIKNKAEKAFALLGLKSLTEYVVDLIDKDATNVITKYENVTVENDIFDKFILACEKAEEPNQALVNAVKLSEQRGIQ